MKILSWLAWALLTALGGFGFYTANSAGAFEHVEAELQERGPYRFAYLDHRGPYEALPEVILQVWKALADRSAGPPASVFLDDVLEVASDRLRSQGGYVVPKDLEVPGAIRVREIKRRTVVAATFQGDPRLSLIKVYSKIGAWMNENGYRKSGPAFERYYPDGTIEYEVPVERAPRQPAQR